MAPWLACTPSAPSVSSARSTVRRTFPWGKTQRHPTRPRMTSPSSTRWTPIAAWRGKPRAEPLAVPCRRHMVEEFVDVLIVGAGLSGIGAASHLQRLCPGRSVAILEARQSLGGTWDLFRYPGIRSDSDMYTLGYSFRPWTGTKSIADG